VGDHTEWKVGAASQPTRYYNAGGMRLATRLDGVMYYPLTDHLGSTTMTTDASGNQFAEIRYKAWGESRYTYGTLPTKHTYTGQYSNVSDFGLIYFNARWYDPYQSFSSIFIFNLNNSERPNHQGSTMKRWVIPSSTAGSLRPAPRAPGQSP